LPFSAIEGSLNQILERVLLGWFLAGFSIHQDAEDLLNHAVDSSLASL
jgi:hypothetical protein